jgi:hypothetical protein
MRGDGEVPDATFRAHANKRETAASTRRGNGLFGNQAPQDSLGDLAALDRPPDELRWNSPTPSRLPPRQGRQGRGYLFGLLVLSWHPEGGRGGYPI